MNDEYRVNGEENQGQTTEKHDRDQWNKHGGKEINKNILVIGDWFVDEDWMTGIHRSSTSSRTGKSHYRGLDPTKAKKTFCGSGLTASIIHRLSFSTNDSPSSGEDHFKDIIKHNIIGIGAWHPNDTEYLAKMVSTAISDDSPDQIKINETANDQNPLKNLGRVELINMADILSPVTPTTPDEENQGSPKKATNVNEYFGTTRIIRIYQKVGKKTQLLERIDWERPPIGNRKMWIPDNIESGKKVDRNLKRLIVNALRKITGRPTHNAMDLDTQFIEDFKEIHAIVIKDMIKGVLSESLIEWLTEQVKAAKKIEEIKWYISSKKWNPKWLELLKEQNMRLIIVPDAALQEAARIKENNLTQWITKNGRATMEALDLLENKLFTSQASYQYPLIVALPKGHQVLALSNDPAADDEASHKTRIIIQDMENITRELPSLERPFASILFGALIAIDLLLDEYYIFKNSKSPMPTFGYGTERKESHNISKGETISRACEFGTLKEALEFAVHHQLIDIHKLTDNTNSSGNLTINVPYFFNKNSMSRTKRGFIAHWNFERLLETVQQAWSDATSLFTMGVIKNCEEDYVQRTCDRCMESVDWMDGCPLNTTQHPKNEQPSPKENPSPQPGDPSSQNGITPFPKPINRGPRIELWRASTEIDGFICLEGSKRQSLQLLVQELQKFKKGDRSRSQSCLLTASPGGGKSYLVKRLAATQGFHLLPFNITQMFSKSDLLDCFDRIATEQSQNPDAAFIVFVDEINATLQAQQVYDTFLAPLEDGYYIRAEKSFYLHPCFWIFAGTNKKQYDSRSSDDSKTSSDETRTAQKISDFDSRLTLKTISLRIGEQGLNPATTEKILRNPESYPTERLLNVLKMLQLERIYSGIAQLTQIFPDVSEISIRALSFFMSIPLTMTTREIGHIIRSFQDIQYSRVRSGNIPDSLWNKYHDKSKQEIEETIKRMSPGMSDGPFSELITDVFNSYRDILSKSDDDIEKYIQMGTKKAFEDFQKEFNMTMKKVIDHDNIMIRIEE